MDLLGLRREEAVQAQLQSSGRNVDIYEQIGGGKGYNRNTQQCCVKVQELQQAHQRAREANSHSGAELQICHFYKVFHAILGWYSTTSPNGPVDTLEESLSQVNRVNIKEKVLDDEEENGGQVTGDPVVQ
ncbi:hypothetical protein UY3_13626 [Chelonia mydas]|uniref:Uncharacterized protein n=1 Tax=Chelonia mydas TaxID=8469 RepID=M7BAV1_CHEMY|nr:hypothetical protein UY3_13626 [Chelonia mydas]